MFAFYPFFLVQQKSHANRQFLFCAHAKNWLRLRNCFCQQKNAVLSHHHHKLQPGLYFCLLLAWSLSQWSWCPKFNWSVLDRFTNDALVLDTNFAVIKIMLTTNKHRVPVTIRNDDGSKPCFFVGGNGFWNGLNSLHAHRMKSVCLCAFCVALKKG